MPNQRPPLRSELQDSDSDEVTTLKVGTIVLLKMREGYNILNDIKRIGFVSEVLDGDKYEVTYKYIIGVGPSVTLRKIIANRPQILNLHLQQKVNIRETEKNIISFLDRSLVNHKFLTDPESHDDLYQNFLADLKSLDNSSRVIPPQDRLTGSYINDGKLGETQGGRSRRRKSRHHKKTNRRRQKSNHHRKSNRHKMHPRKNNYLAKHY